MFTVMAVLDGYFGMLRDTSVASQKPYSYSRVQLAWWTSIILAAIITIVSLGQGIPTITGGLLVLLGISSATSALARVSDISDRSNPTISSMAQDCTSEGFFYDILSDENGINIHRLQTAIFNTVFGVWFVSFVYSKLGGNVTAANINLIMPDFDQNNLILLGVSSGTYAALKTTENKK
jgi:hypothetical protein